MQFIRIRAFIVVASEDMGTNSVKTLEYYHTEIQSIEITAFVTVAAAGNRSFIIVSVAENGNLQYFHIEILCSFITFIHS
jgi:hypothetical protein